MTKKYPVVTVEGRIDSEGRFSAIVDPGTIPGLHEGTVTIDRDGTTIVIPLAVNVAEAEAGVTDSAGCWFESAAEMYIESQADGLGWCNCGHPERVQALLLEYLDALSMRVTDPDGNADWRPSFERVEAMGDAGHLLAEVCCAQGWTEHGGNVRGSWLTHEGKKVLEALRGEQG